MGRFKLIDSPQTMWDLFVRYKKWVSDNPIQIEDYVGKDAHRVMREKPRPLTMEGFECFVMDNSDISYPDLSQYFSNRDNAYEDFSAICSRIRKEIRRDQIEGGMVGQYNPSITQRLNGLKEQVEQTNIEQPLFNLNDNNNSNKED